MKRRLLAVLAAVTLAVPAGAQLPAGPEFRVNEFTVGSQRGPSPAFFPDGSFVVSWTDGPQPGLAEIFARRYSPSGAPLGGQFQVNVVTAGYQQQSAVGAAPDGRFVVVWTGYDDSFYGVRLRAYDSQGNPAGPEVPVNTVTSNEQWLPRVAYGGDGFLVAWLGDNDVRARVFDASGAARGGEFQVNTYTAYEQSVYSVAGWRGGFVVAWSSPHLKGEADIFVRRLDRDGSPIGAEFRVNTTTGGYQGQPTVGIADDGSFVVAWESFTTDGSSFFAIVARAFAADGAPLGPEVLVNGITADSQRHPRLAADAHAGFVVAWSTFPAQGPGPDGSRGAVLGRRLARGGRPLAPTFVVNTYTTGDQGGVRVAGLPDGRVLVGWTSVGQDGHLSGVFAQRYGSLAPLRLDVDASPGPSSNVNGVLEPGETAPLAPAWRNLNTAAAAVNGTAVSFTGPGTASYTIVDGAAAYGTIAPGAAASCGDCYVLSVGVPPTRPATHWDARMEEELTLARAGSWRVHLGDSFTDVPRASEYYRFVETLLHHGVTGGCGASLYCPGDATAREQMAALLLAAREGSGYVPPACAPPNLFEDVPETSPFCRWIEELARRGVTGGCDAGRFCPGAAVTREQMAVFVLRTLDPQLDPPACAPPNLFLDVPESSAFCRWIEELARRGVVAGCGGGNYCPADAVTREQMAVFLAATFALNLYPA